MSFRGCFTPHEHFMGIYSWETALLCDILFKIEVVVQSRILGFIQSNVLPRRRNVSRPVPFSKDSFSEVRGTTFSSKRFLVEFSEDPDGCPSPLTCNSESL